MTYHTLEGAQLHNPNDPGIASIEVPSKVKLTTIHTPPMIEVTLEDGTIGLMAVDHVSFADIHDYPCMANDGAYIIPDGSSQPVKVPGGTRLLVIASQGTGYSYVELATKLRGKISTSHYTCP